MILTVLREFQPATWQESKSIRQHASQETISLFRGSLPLFTTPNCNPYQISKYFPSFQPRLADTRRSAIHCADVDMEYYRLRSFSITSHGICNLGDSMRRVDWIINYRWTDPIKAIELDIILICFSCLFRSRRSRSINSVTSSNSGRDRNNRWAWCYGNWISFV